MTPDYQVSLEFLRVVYPSGPWMLTAISVDKKRIDARSFAGDAESAAVLAWLESHGDRNLYYSVNEPIEAAREKRKLSKTDVSRVHFLHVDVDPRAGEPVPTEQARILRQLESYKIRPTVLVFSGGGYNALWRLSSPIDVAAQSPSTEETIARAIDIERRNWQFELDFETPDHCRDVSRILRLPGTINRPNAEKIAKGRTPSLSRVIWSDGPTHDYSVFLATPHVASNAPTRGPSTVAADVVRTESLDSLSIPEKLKVIIAQGFDPDKDKWDGDRSGVLYFACCEMVRAGLSDSVILGIITDSRYLISASVLDKGAGTQRYAMRQVQRARDHADNPLLAIMNDEYAVILSYGASTVVMVEKGRHDEKTGEITAVFQSFRDFKNRIKSLPAVPTSSASSGKVKMTSAFEWWTSHPRRRTFRDVAFEPGLETPGRYNLWTGFAVSPVPGDAHLRLLAHVHDNICDGRTDRYEYLVNWMARVVQTPRTSSAVAPVLLGSRGTGKSVFTEYFARLFGRHAFVASDVEDMTGKFNAHLAYCVFLVAEEAFELKNKRHESVLKQLITGGTNAIEKKGVDKVQLPNYVHLIMTSNNERVIPAGDHERRFLALRVSDARRQDESYFRPILEDRDDAGPSNLLHFLLSRDLSKFSVFDVPQTEELRRQQIHNVGVELEWLLEKLTFGIWLPGHAGWTAPVRKKLLHEDYRQFLTNSGVRSIYVRGERAFHGFIMESLPGTTDRQAVGSGPADRPMVFQFQPLAVCRETFCRLRGWTTHEWPVVAEVESAPGVVVQGVFE